MGLEGPCYKLPQLSWASATAFRKGIFELKVLVGGRGTAISMHSRGSIRCNKASLLQGLVVFPGSAGVGVGGGEPDWAEVIQRADLLLSSFQGHLWVLSQAILQSLRSSGTGCWDLWYAGLLAGWPSALGGKAGSSAWCVGTHLAGNCKDQHSPLSRHG